MNIFKDMLIEKESSMTDIQVEQEQTESKSENTLLKRMSIIIEEKIEKTLIRLNSLDVELCEDVSELIKYVTDFAINFSLKKKYGDNVESEFNVKQFFNGDSDNELETIALEILNEFFDEIMHVNELEMIEEETKISVGDILNENCNKEFFYDENDHNKVYIPPVWTPSFKRTNAALIYLFFRQVIIFYCSFEYF